MGELPPWGSAERDEIEERTSAFAAHGCELLLTEQGLTEQVTGWYALVIRRDTALLSVPPVHGWTAIGAARNAWHRYTTDPSLHIPVAK